MASWKDRASGYVHKHTFYDEAGNEYRVAYDYNMWGNKSSAEIRKNGEFLRLYTTGNLNNRTLERKIIGYDRDFKGDTALSYDEYKQFKADIKTEEKAEEKSEEFKEELGEQIESAKEEMRALGESKDAEMRRISSRTTASNQKSLTDALLATGTDPAEAQAITQYGVDAQTRTLSDVLSKSALATKEAVASFNNQEIQGVVNAEQFQTKYADMANRLSIQRENLTNQLNIAEMQSDTYRDMNTPTMMENISGGAQAFASGAQGLEYLRLAGLIGGVPVG